MMGGVGFIKDYPVEKFYRDAKIGKYSSYMYSAYTMTTIHVCTKLTYWYVYMQVKSMKGPHLFNSTLSPNVWTMSSRTSKNKIYFVINLIIADHF